MADIRTVRDMNGLITYFSENLGWEIDLNDFDDIEDISYEFDAADIGLKDEAFAKIASMRQLQPLVDDQQWGIFCIEFESQRFEVSAIRKILSGLIPRRRASVDHAMWQQQDLLFICNWGEGNNRTLGLAHFEDKEKGLPQIKMISCAPAVEDFTQIKQFEDSLKKLTWPRDTSNIVAWREQWSSAFSVAYREVIQTSSMLTIRLAAEAQNIRDRVLETLEVENENGYVHKLYEKFRAALIHDMTETAFADMYAQTVVYGLFSARCMDTTQEDFSVREAVTCIPNTNPFLKELMRECLGADSRDGEYLGAAARLYASFDELDIGNVVDLLAHTNTDAIIRDFNRQTGGGREDPIIHFYEEFLTAYDKQQKVQRGVFYTPQPVVNFMVRAIDDILKNEFDYEDGLASIKTKEIEITRKSKKKNDRGFYYEMKDTEEVPAVQVLDPATGTGTFLRQVILQIYDNFRAKLKGKTDAEIKAAWNEYVPRNLLPRINGFELMMAPYAVAHMKLAMVLYDTGYEFSSDTRLNVCLTNTLEPPGDADDQISMWSDPLAMESIQANRIKNNNGISIVIGNPPYSGGSANKGAWILDLMNSYHTEPGGRERLKEIKTHIDNDYVKFIRYAQNLLDKNKNGIIAYINPRDYLYSPTFRGMRWRLLSSFDEIYIVDLHGDMRQNKNSTLDDNDENVFDIQVGVCIEIMVKRTTKKTGSLAKVYHTEIRGGRELKFQQLNSMRLFEMPLENTPMIEPFFSFKPQYVPNSSFENTFSISDLYNLSVNGIQTGRDSLTIRNSYDEMKRTIEDFCSLPPEVAREKYGLGNDGRDWRVEWAQKDVRKHLSDGCITPILYRPFDIKWTFYTGPDGKGFLQCPRGKVMKNMVGNDNLALIVGRQGQAVGNIEWCLAFVSDGMPTDLNLFYRGGGMVFPLYNETSSFSTTLFVPNLKDDIAERIAQKMDMSYSPGIEDGRVVTPRKIMSYIYAILFSHKYRKEFANLLLLDFPKIPYPEDYEYFCTMVELGNELIRIHTFADHPDTIVHCTAGDNRISKYHFKNNRIYLNEQQYYDDVDENVWNYYIGGYQPLQKWLKDRKNNVLSIQEMIHYQGMIDAIKQTIKVMEKIDEIIRI